MSMDRNLWIALVLTLANWQCVYGQTEQLPNAANTNAPDEPRIALQLRFYEFIDRPANASAIAELTGKRTDTDSAAPTVNLQNENECVHSTEQLTRRLDDLCKASSGKVLSETQILLSPGVQTRYQHGEELDFAERSPKRNKMIDLCETIGQDSASVDAAHSGSIRFVGTTILATGTIESTPIVKLQLKAKETQLDTSPKTKFPGLRIQSVGVSVELRKDQSLILGSWRSHREEVRTEKIPVLSSIPGIGSAFDRKLTAARPTIVFVVATPEIFQP